MKKYTDLSFVETAQALEDKKHVEWAEKYPIHPRWTLKTDKSVYSNCRYRLVEEAEPQYRPIKHTVRQFDGSSKEWTAEVGDMVQVKHKDDSEWRLGVREYRGVVDGKFFCRLNSCAKLVSWDEIAPVTKIKDLSHLISFDDGMDDEEEKREPEVCWRNKYPNYLACESYSTLDDAVLSAMSGCVCQVKFVEEIEK